MKITPTKAALLRRLRNDWSAHLSGKYPKNSQLEQLLDPTLLSHCQIVVSLQRSLDESQQWGAADSFTPDGEWVRLYRCGVLTRLISI